MYAKLFGSIVHSTIWREADYVRLVWITMLALADKKGCVWASVPGLADAARVTTDECRLALERLASPDPDSRTQVAEGRRIETIDGGWWIINYDKFQAIKNIDERREQVRKAVARHRAKKQDEPAAPNVINSNHEKSGNPPVSPSDEAETRPTQITTSSSSSARDLLLSRVAHRETWEAEFNSALQGMHGPLLTAEQLEQAIGDYVGNGAAEKPSLRHFRAYLRDAARPPSTREPSKRNGTTWGRRNDDVLKRFGEEED